MSPSDPLQDYQAAREKTALFDMSGLGKLLFKGPDRQAYLNGQFSSDIKNLKGGQGLPTCVLTPKGKLEADFVLYDRAEDLLSIHQPQATSAILGALKKSLPLADVTVEDVTGRFCSFWIGGRKVPEVLEAVFDAPFNLPPYACRPAAWKNGQIWVLSDPRLTKESLLLLAPNAAAPDLKDALLDKGRPYDLTAIGPQAVEMLRRFW